MPNPCPCRLRERLLRLAAALLLLVSLATSARAAEFAAWPGRIEAARADWNAPQPPPSGWVDVTLPDDWSRRWPQHDGVVWYRLSWQQPETDADTALLIRYTTLAARITLNGSLLASDRSLVEPLSRSWNTPRYFVAAPPLLRRGGNQLLIRVAGLSTYEPGLGPVEIGPAAELYERYTHDDWLRQRMGLAGLAVGITLGACFLALWAMRRREVAYGWYGAQQLCWFPIAWNQIATSPWPFASTHTYQVVAVTLPLLLFTGCYCMFVLRFCGRHWPRREAALWLLLAAAAVWLLGTPHEAIRGVRDAIVTGGALANLATHLLFIALAWHGGRTDQRILSLFVLIAIVAGVHDALVLTRVLGGNTYYASLTTNLTVVGVALVLAWNFVRSLRRIEGFNRELLQRVEDARAELAGTLRRQHELELVHARLGERVGLAHDLHDGLGGLLIGNIAALEQAPESLPSQTVLDMLRELRDDLRLIIDTAAAQQHGEHSLADVLAPLRHRMTRLFEAHDMAIVWQVESLENVHLSTSQHLDVLRVLQEALTNVLRHSRAQRVDVLLRSDASGLRLEVRDDGAGPPQPGRDGTGMRSMRARARRLQAEFTIERDAGATVVRLLRAWPAA